FSLTGCKTTTTTETTAAATTAAATTVAETTAAATTAAETTAADILAGKAVDENGKPYLLGYEANEVGSGWMSSSVGYAESIWKRMGGEFVSFVSGQDLAKELSQMDDLLQMKPDAILLHASDSKAIAPAVTKVQAAGVPVFAIDMGVEADVVSFVTMDQNTMGIAAGNYIKDNFSADNPANILVIAGSLKQDAAIIREGGFESVVKTLPYAKISQIIDCNWTAEKGLNGVLDAFQRDPTINAIFTHSDLYDQAIVQGLKQVGKLFKVGEAGHVVVLGIDGAPDGVAQINAGYLDGSAENNALMDVCGSFSVILGHLYGQEIPKKIMIPSQLITIANVAECWGSLPAGQFDSWPWIPNDAAYTLPSR
ncbi:MAG: sugar ABC transporter substrate-binding protein, partial [Bacteroidales bacterium]|nr:sugar ABC transporter substrate-binding protein [Bacteroidales bacterium]